MQSCFKSHRNIHDSHWSCTLYINYSDVKSITQLDVLVEKRSAAASIDATVGCACLRRTANPEGQAVIAIVCYCVGA